ncbi:MAG: nitroreductase family protein [Salinivirgaceae bacterium]|nr:nitroreductase family protein [Salinivirgaceae bacterium]
MKSSTIIIVVLAVALLFAVIKILTTSKQALAGSNADAVISNIMTRTSIRSYTDEPLTDSQIETLLRAGMAAPSAVNKQPWKFVVVKNKPILQQIADSLPNTRLSSAVCAIVVCGDMTKTLDGVAREFWIHDCSAATENILLAAHALELGAVWAGIFPNPDRVDKLRGLIDLSETQIPLCVIAIGHPAENPTPKDKWNQENYRVIE